ncbi:MAG: M56 family metallopeptidase [Pseudomonadota bacterium]
MTAWLDLLWLLLVVALASWAVAVVGLSLVGGSALRPQLPPGPRARRAVLLALLPWLVPITVVGALAVVAASKPAGLTSDHCLIHGTGHPHICFEHLPAIGLGPTHAAGAAVLLLAVLLPALRLLLREWQLATRIDALRRLAVGWRRLRIVSSAEPIALAVGGRDSTVLLSRGLLDRLDPRERRIVLGHELAHLRQGDPVRHRLFEWLLLLQPGWTGRPLRRHWRQAREELADDRVAREYGAEAVAGVLLKVIRMGRSAEAAGPAFVGPEPRRRVARLIHTDEPMTRPLFEWGYAALLLLTGVTAAIAHHSLETALGWVIG